MAGLVWNGSQPEILWNICLAVVRCSHRRPVPFCFRISISQKKSKTCPSLKLLFLDTWQKLRKCSPLLRFWVKHSSYFLEDSLAAPSHPRFSLFSAGTSCWIPGWQLWPIQVYRCHPRWTRRFSMWRLWMVRWLSQIGRLKTTTLGGYSWQTRSHRVKSKHAKLDAIFPLKRSEVGCKGGTKRVRWCPFCWISGCCGTKFENANLSCWKQATAPYSKISEESKPKMNQTSFYKCDKPFKPFKISPKKNENLPK